MKKHLSRCCIGSCVIFLTACGSPQPANFLATNAVKNVGCKVSQSEMWNALHQLIEERATLPAPLALQQALIEQGEQHGLTDTNYKGFVSAFVSHYQTTVEGIRENFDPQDIDSWKKALAEMEVGIRVSKKHELLQDKVSASLEKLAAAEDALDVSCSIPEQPARTPASELDPVVDPAPQPSPSTNVWEQMSATENPEVVGLRKTLAVAYQSCEAAALSPMTTSTPAVDGIKIIGTRPDGGKIRKVDSLSALVSTDYYVRNLLLAKNSCFDVRKDPLIYNYGAKPYTTVSTPNVLNLFKRVTSGGPSLGIDCSGFVFSALAVAGLKMDPDPKKILKADLVKAIPSGAFKEPQSNGLRCLQKITPTAAVSILPGDIVAINGHVVMVDSIGTDPFGLQRVTKLDDCDSQHLGASGFDFVIGQSAPIKNGIGINRIHIRDYLSSSGTIHDGLIRYAVAACRARLGASPNVSSPSLSIVRHLRTKECRAEPLVLTNSDCIDSCRVQ